MTYKMILTTAALSALCGPALAQGFTGGQIGIGYEAPVDGGDFGGTTYSLGGEYAFTRDFSVAGDVSSYRLDNIDEDASSVTIHGIYHFSQTASAGVFIGQDYLTGDDANLFGVEAGTEFMGGDVGGYIGSIDGNSDGIIAGLDGEYAFGNGVSLTANAGFYTSDDGDADLSRFAIGSEYRFDSGLEFYAELGNVAVSLDDRDADETYLGIGATLNFGAARGTTFDQRSLFEILPGF